MPGAAFPASTMAGGTCLGVPDVCLVPAPPAPPIPTPFANMAQCSLATGTTTKVLIMNMPALTQGSKIPMSQGDEAGSAGGVVSGVILGEVAFRTSSSKVSFQGQKAVVLTAVTAHNGTNANMPAGVHVAPSQTKVLVGM
jgi:hypothetical protein